MANNGQTNHKDIYILPLAQSIDGYSAYVSVVAKNISYCKRYFLSFFLSFFELILRLNTLIFYSHKKIPFGIFLNPNPSICGLARSCLRRAIRTIDPPRVLSLSLSKSPGRSSPIWCKYTYG